MVSYAVVNAASRRLLVRQAVAHSHKRGMAGIGSNKGPPPKWEGADKVVRSYFPEDHQLAAAILGGYLGLIGLYTLYSKLTAKKKVEAPAPVVEASTTASGEIPDVNTPEFAKYISSEEFYKLLENEEQLKAMSG